MHRRCCKAQDNFNRSTWKAYLVVLQGTPGLPGTQHLGSLVGDNRQAAAGTPEQVGTRQIGEDIRQVGKDMRQVGKDMRPVAVGTRRIEEGMRQVEGDMRQVEGDMFQVGVDMPLVGMGKRQVGMGMRQVGVDRRLIAVDMRQVGEGKRLVGRWEGIGRAAKVATAGRDRAELREPPRVVSRRDSPASHGPPC